MFLFYIVSWTRFEILTSLADYYEQGKRTGRVAVHSALGRHRRGVFVGQPQIQRNVRGPGAGRRVADDYQMGLDGQSVSDDSQGLDVSKPRHRAVT